MDSKEKKESERVKMKIGSIKKTMKPPILMNENGHVTVEMRKSITTDGTDSVRSVDMKPYNETPMFDAREEITHGG